MEFVRGCGYWADKLYWLVKYRDEYVCFIQLDVPECRGSWTIWSDDSASDALADVQLDERMEQIAWAHVDFCGCCGGSCQPGARRTIFGRTFDGVCRTPIRFDDPDAEAIECAMRLMDIRAREIAKGERRERH